jgi:hypothetical protein
MIVQDHVLYSRVLTPAGRIVNEPTFLGIALGAIAVCAIAGGVLFLFAFL